MKCLGAGGHGAARRKDCARVHLSRLLLSLFVLSRNACIAPD